MAATDSPATLSELRTVMLSYLKEATGVTAINTMVDSCLNQALLDFHQEDWPWLERRGVLVTKAPYTTGTIAVNEGDTAVTGSSTLWTTTNDFGVANAAAGDKMTIGSTTDVYLISAVGGAGGITLGSRYTGSDISADGSYAVFQDEYALATGFDRLVDARLFSEPMKIAMVGPREFYRQYPRNSVRQRPRLATIIELGPSGSTERRPRVLLGPAPDNEYTIPYRYYTEYNAVSASGTEAVNLSAAGDLPLCPVRWRMALVWKALSIWYDSRKPNPELSTSYEQRYSTLVMRARQALSKPTDDRPRLALAQTGYAPWRAYRRSPRLLTTGQSSRFDQLLDA